ncbi:MAG TPA: carboxypeptidase regulatory-like domain-containing protein [Bryobacteraceae bacterium]|nr:carboxypeptidase regulatory-like domain-containing protein [Bryobacteraceae bacterium]
MRKLSYVVAIIIALMIVSTLLTAQSVVTGELAGTVTDPTGAIIANSKVTLKNEATGETQTATTNDSGEFRFSLLRPGQYTLTAAAQGFQETSQKATVSLGQVVNVRFQLGIQSQAQVVNVTEQPNLAQTENANLATTYNSLQLENLPAPGNDMTAFAFTTPGVTISTGAGYGNFSAFGLPGVSNLFTINGTDNMDPYLNLNNSGASNLTLGSNEIQEAAVVLNGYTGQYGRQAGAQVNYITKTGTNAFHGNAGWYWNGAKLNANDWFNNANATDRPHAVSNEWADSIGGPIKKNKAFFFFDNEGIRYVLPSGGPPVFIPTSDFASFVLNNLKAKNAPAVPLYTTAFNLYAGASGAGRATPATKSDDPTLGCGDFSGGGFGTAKPCAAKFQSTVNNLNTEWLLGARVDYNVTDRDRIYFRYNTDHGVQATGTDPINPAFNANSVQPQYGGQFGYTRVLNTTMVNQLLLSASYYTALFGPPNISAALSTFPTTWAFGDGLFNSNAVGTSLGGLDFNYPQGRKVRQWQLIDDYSVIHGTHTFKFGANVRKNWVSTYAAGVNTSGLMTFNSMTDFVNGTLTPAGGSTYSQAFTRIGAEGLTLYSAGFYLQDEWKIRPNLIMTVALRLDRNSNIQCSAGCFNELGQPFAQVGHSATTPYNQTIQTGLHQAFPGVEAVVPTPRVGVAWNVTKSTVLRGGVGLFTDLYQGVIADRFVTNSPAVASFSTSSGLVALNSPNSAFAAVANSANAFQTGFANGATLAQLQAQVAGFKVPNFNTIANNLNNPKYLEWNFEVQQGLGNKYLLSVNYVGNHGYDGLNQSLFSNQFAASGFAGLPTSAPDARFGEVRELTNKGYSNYDGLVSSFKWRMNAQFSGQFSYTWSHALDTCSNACLEPFNLLTAPSIRYQITPFRLSYGAADYDARHSLSANYVYTMPGSKFQNAVLKGVLGGWTAAGTFFYHSGYPFSVVDTGARGAQGIGNATGISGATQSVIADYLSTGFPSCSTPNINCYSTSQFATKTTQFDFGNIPRNAFRGPGYFDTDLNINKTFSVHERYKLTVGAFFFNILNHPNFDLPVNNVALGGFGQIQSTVSAPTSAYGSFQGSAVSGRVIQTMVKVTF